MSVTCSARMPATPSSRRGSCTGPSRTLGSRRAAGEYLVTNGREWQWRVLPDGQVFHVHAMAASDRTLYAATSAWRAGLRRSDDAAATWRVVYDQPTPRGLVSRLTALAVLDQTLYAGLTAFGDGGAKLLRADGDTGASGADQSKTTCASSPEGPRVLNFTMLKFGLTSKSRGSVCE